MDHPLYGGKLMANKNKDTAKRRQAVKNANLNIKKAASDGKVKNSEIKRIASNSNLSTKKLQKLIGKTEAKTGDDNVGFVINKKRMEAPAFNKKKDKLINKYDAASVTKDPYTRKPNQKKLDRIDKKLETFGVTGYKPNVANQGILEAAQKGETISAGKLEQIALNNPGTQANTLAKYAADAGLTLNGGGEITAKTIRGYHTAAAEAAEAAANPVTQADNQVLDIKKIMEGFQTMLTNSMSNQPDIGALLKGVTDSQNAMFGNMMNNNRIQQSQMNPMRMSPVLGVRSAGMQNYGLNNATNAFGRGGTRIGGLKNNSLNLS
jgi:DNA polymerase III alpha subunit (gram-positive type)